MLPSCGELLWCTVLGAVESAAACWLRHVAVFMDAVHAAGHGCCALCVCNFTNLHPSCRLPACRPLRAAAPSIFEGLTELFELYLLHVFVTFGDVSLAELQQAAIAAAHSEHCGAAGQLGGSGQHGGSGGLQDAALTPRLRAALLRIAQDSIGKYRQMFGAHSGSRLARALAPPAAPSQAAAAAGPAGQRPASAAGSSSMSGASQYFRRTLPGSAGSSPAPMHGVGPAAAGGAAPVASPAGPPGVGPAAAAAAAAVPAAPTAVEVSVLSNAGNLYGLVERLTAAECLLAVGSRLQAARGPLAAALPPGEGAHALETFFSRTVGAAEDLRDFLVGTGKCERVGYAALCTCSSASFAACLGSWLGRQLCMRSL